MGIVKGHFCKQCGRPYEDLPYYEDQVGCPVHDIPAEAEFKPYTFQCWVPGCLGEGDSIRSIKSSTPGMGYHCPICNADLTEWKRRRNEIHTDHKGQRWKSYQQIY